MVWSDDGSRMIVAAEETLHVFDAEGLSLRTVAAGAAVAELAVSSDGARAGFTTGTRQMWFVDLASGQKSLLFDPGPGMRFCTRPAWSSDSRALTFEVIEKRVDVKTGMFVTARADLYWVKADGTGLKLVLTRQ